MPQLQLDEADIVRRDTIKTLKAQLARAEARAERAERRLFAWGSIGLLAGILGGAAVGELLPLLLGVP